MMGHRTKCFKLFAETSLEALLPQMDAKRRSAEELMRSESS